jgi:hypothetical protein
MEPRFFKESIKELRGETKKSKRRLIFTIQQTILSFKIEATKGRLTPHGGLALLKKVPLKEVFEEAKEEVITFPSQSRPDP